MTEEQILQEIEKLKTQLEEIRTRRSAGVIAIDDAERERLHQEDLQRIRGFRLIDDDFMNACFDGFIEGAELLLRIILNKPDMRVKSVTTQRRMKNLSGRDVCLDIDAFDDSGKEYDIEVQRSDRGADRKRARYLSSILDAHLLQPNVSFNELPETFVIFITENDVIGKGKPLYRIERHIEETYELFDDGEHIVYVNGADKDASTELGKLMQDFFCTDPDDMNYKQLADKVRYFKEDEKGVATMCKVMEDMRKEVVENDRIQNAIRMLKDGIPVEKVAQYQQLPLEKVKELVTINKVG